MTKVLPFPDKPIFLSYHSRAFPFGIIQANSKEDITKWACSKSVDFVCRPGSSKNIFNIDVHDLWGLKEKILIRQTIKIKSQYIKSLDENLIEVIKNAINDNCYVYGLYNERYISSKEAFEKYDFWHDFLLIGYNDNGFVSVGYTKEGKFKRFEITFEALLNGLFKEENTLLNLSFYEYDGSVTPSINAGCMIEDLNKYITEYKGDHIYSEQTIHGISAAMLLKEYFNKEVSVSNRNSIDRRYSAVFYEHKWVLSKIVDLFIDGSEKDNIKNYAENNVTRAKQIYLLGSKMAMTGNKDSIRYINDLMEKIIEDEKKYLPELTSQLQKRY